MNIINRRQFMLMVSGGTAALLLARYNQKPAMGVSSPKVYQSQHGLVELDLQASYGRVQLAEQSLSALSYNHQIPGPRLEVKPGDTVKINLNNQLNQDTNLHYHGLHITPQGKGDNHFIMVPPQERFTYEFTIPKHHRPGTYWYHPHVHGITASQLFGGLAGLIIVRGDLDEIPEIKAAQEEFIVLQDFALNSQGAVNISSQQNRIHGQLMRGREGNLITVNGQINPTLSIAAGGLLRLRVLNASPSRFYRLKLEAHPFYLIATDGGAVEAPIELEQLVLAPGERAELLVKGDQIPGRYRLLNLPYNRGGMGGMMGVHNPQQNQIKQLATISYQNQVSPLALPKTLTAIERLTNPTKIRSFDLNHGMTFSRGMVFSINDQIFNEHQVNTRVKINTVEDWDIVNSDMLAHPFHVHINPFQVISRNNEPVSDLAWKDTVIVSPGETVRCRLRFEDFLGKTVYHCHISDHEDLGMMGILEIV